MRRLNVRPAQIEECIQKSMFAFSVRPQNPELQPGEPLLLQLVKTEAARLGKLHSRIDFALVFDHLEPDYDGMISRLHWPKEHRVWPWIVYGSATVPTIPFSLEDLDLSMDYDGQTNPRYIEPRDERLIRPYIQWSLAEVPKATLQSVPASQVAQRFRTGADALGDLQPRPHCRPALGPQEDGQRRGVRAQPVPRGQPQVVLREPLPDLRQGLLPRLRRRLLRDPPCAVSGARWSGYQREHRGDLPEPPPHHSRDGRPLRPPEPDLRVPKWPARAADPPRPLREGAAVLGAVSGSSPA